LKNADSVNNLKLRIKLQHDQAGVNSTGPGEWGLMD